MGVLRACDDNFTFIDGAPFSPTAASALTNNLILLDRGTRLGGVVFGSLYGQYPEEWAQQTQIIWRGGGVYETGITQLRVVTHTTGTVVTGDTLRVYRGDDDSTFTDHTIASGTQTFTIAISGYTPGQPLAVRCEVRHSAAPAAQYTGSRTQVVIAEFVFTSVAIPPPTNPTFTTTADLNGTKLTQLAEFVNWLIWRTGVRYDPVPIWQLRRNGPYCIPIYGTDPNVVWRGGVRRSALHTTLRAQGAFLIQWGGATESVRLSVNGSIVASAAAPTLLGERSWELTHDLSGYADGSVLRLAIDYVRTAPIAENTPINRWSVGRVAVEAPMGTAASLTSFAIRQSAVSAASILSWAQAARTLAQAVFDRMVANGAFWGVQRLYTARPAMDLGKDLSQFTLFEPWSVPVATRAGEALVGRGQALSLGYRGAFFDEAKYAEMAKTNDGVGAYPLEHTRTQPYIDGDDVESLRLYFDSVPQLAVGDRYFVRGVNSFVLMEQLKVVD